MGFEVGKTVAGYEIVEVLGSSKLGVAYKVRNVFAQRFEILKILPKGGQDNEEQTARFLREIKVHARLVHPHIVTFYNAREIEGQLVMTTEFVPGITVAERLEVGPIASKDAVKYACHALSALECAHESGIIHRGLTAASLVITTEGIVRLSGFGLAKSIGDPQLTAVGTVVGALRYISPEQVQGTALDARCDIYSLGVVFYEMLTGKLPFEGKGQFEIMLAHVNTAPSHPSDVNAEAAREVGDIVLKALAKEPAHRFQTAQEFRAALEQVSGERQGAALASVGAGIVAVPVDGAVAQTSNGSQSASQLAFPWQESPMQPAAATAFTATPSSVSVNALEAVPAEGASIFGDTFASKLGISLAACIITLIVGSIALLAVLAVTKP
jgi:eukaryotic-like serine/threonine-protein kinase